MKIRKIAVLLTLLMLTLLMLTTTLFACTGAERGTSIESETEEPQSEEISSEISSSEESSKEELSSEASSEAVSSEEDDKPRLNEDLLSDIGLTYPELVKKRGKLVEVGGAGGGVSFIFENGYGQYFWGEYELDYGKAFNKNKKLPPMPKDENGKIIIEKAYLPKSHIKCNTMGWVKVQDLFLGLSASITAIEIEKIYNVEYEGSHDVNGFDGWNYGSSFSYGNVEIGIYTNKKGLIDLDSRMGIGLLSRRFADDNEEIQ